MKLVDWQTYLNDHQERFDAELLELVRIPSVSTDPERADDVRKAAEWVRRRLRAAGLPFVEIIETPRHPVVFGRWATGDGRPTLLIYGHYDVQPAEPLELWESPPFEPVERDGRLYARGSSDMKANMTALIQAIEAIGKTVGTPPVDLLVLFEGEEEVGSPNLPDVVRERRDQLRADVALSADGGMSDPEVPTLSVGLKGLAGCQIDVRTGSTDLHSGSYGAAVPNAVQVLVQLAATFHNPDHSVAIEGFYDDVRPLTDHERATIGAAPADDDAFLEESGALGLWGEAGYSTLERRWTRPTLDFNGIWGGFQGQGAKTVTPSQAHAKITCRLVPDQSPERVLELIERHVARHAPPYAEIFVEPLKGSADPYLLDLDTPALKTAAAALQEVYGIEPRYVRSGGTVPITNVFKEELGLQTVTIGFAKPGSRAHAPNEWFDLAELPRARRVYATFLMGLGGESGDR
jgi:acetylornithine deacetylase/succinyl-diaminopimelate desuccinylase-like protein